MRMDMWNVIAIAVLVLALVLVPIGLPGTWVQVLVLAGATFFDRFSPVLLIGVLVLATLGEAAEYALMKRYSARYGGSRKAFWGALIGGMLGVMVGVPVPVVGSVIAGIVGSFAGAGAVTYWETRHWGTAGRVGWGVVLGRVFAAAAKLGAGVCIVVLGAAGLLLR